MRCLVYEPDHVGHHFDYLRHLVPAVRALVNDVVVVIDRSGLNTTQYREHLEPLQAQISIDAPLIRRARFVGLTSAWEITRGLREAVKRHRPDHVYVPYADGISQILGLGRMGGLHPFPGAVESEGLMMRGHFAYPARRPAEWMKARLSRTSMSLAPWTRVHHLDPIPFEIIQRRGGAFAARSRVMPEPVEQTPVPDKAEARRLLGLAPNARYIGCAGHLSHRKGVDLLIAAFAAHRRPLDRLLLVGELEPRLEESIHRDHRALTDAGAIVIINRFVTNEQLHTSLSAMDVVAVPYRRHIGSSGIVLRAAAVGRPVVGSDYGWVGSTIRRFHLGRTCCVTDIDDLASALAAAQPFSLHESTRRLLAFHTTGNYVSAWTARLRERLGLPRSPPTPTWRWVLDGVE